MSFFTGSLTLAALALLSALGLEYHLRQRDHDRRKPIDASKFDINNDMYHHVDWWTETSEMRALRAMTPARASYFDRVAQQTLPAGTAPKILDIGCGAGFVAMEMASKGYEVVGVDPSHQSLEQARAKAASIEWSQETTSPRFVTGNALALSIPDESVDYVIMADVLEHIGDLPAAVREAARVLKPGGIFSFDTINRTRKSWLLTIFALQHLGIGGICPPNTHDWALYITPDELRDIFAENNLQIQEIKGLQISISPSFVWKMLTFDTFDPKDVFIGDDTDANYIGFAVKQPNAN